MIDNFRLFEAIGEIDDSFILEVDITPVTSHRKVWRTVLIAALIAALFTCTAYAMGLFGLQSHLLPIWASSAASDESVTDYASALRKIHSREYISLGGVAGTPEYEAAAEWMAFKHEYEESKGNDTSWRDLDHSFAENDRQRKIAAMYGADDSDMLAKLLEIAQRYDVGLHSEKSDYDSGMLRIETPKVYENGAYSFSYHPRKPDIQNGYDMYFEKHGTMAVNTLSVSPNDEFNEWEYTTAHEYKVYIAFSSLNVLERDNLCPFYIFASGDTGEITIVSSATAPDAYSEAETLADSVDFAYLFDHPDITGAIDSVGSAIVTTADIPKAVAVDENAENIMVPIPETGVSDAGRVNFTSTVKQSEIPASMPIVTAKYKMMGIDTARKAAEIFFGEAELYEGERLITKAELAERIASMEATYLTDEAIYESVGENISDEMLEYLRAERMNILDELRSSYEYAPETATVKEYQWKFWNIEHYFSLGLLYHNPADDRSYDAPQPGMSTCTDAVADINGERFRLYAGSIDLMDYKYFSLHFGVDDHGRTNAYLPYADFEEPTAQQLENAVNKVRDILRQLDLGEWELTAKAHGGEYENSAGEIVNPGWSIGVEGKQIIEGYSVSFGKEYIYHGAVSCRVTNDGEIYSFTIENPIEVVSVAETATKYPADLDTIAEKSFDFWSWFEDNSQFTKLNVQLFATTTGLQCRETQSGLTLVPTLYLVGNRDYYTENDYLWESDRYYGDGYATIAEIPLA